MKSELLALTLGFLIFVTYTFGGALFQRHVMYIDGSILEFIFTCILGFIFVKVFHLELRGKEIFLASFMVYGWGVLFSVLRSITLERGDSIAKMIFRGVIVELVSLGIVCIALLLFSQVVKKVDR